MIACVFKVVQWSKNNQTFLRSSELAIKLKEVVLEPSLLISGVSSSVCSINKKSQQSVKYWQILGRRQWVSFCPKTLVNPHKIIRWDRRINQVVISDNVCSCGVHISRKITGLEEAQKKNGRSHLMRDWNSWDSSYGKGITNGNRIKVYQFKLVNRGKAAQLLVCCKNCLLLSKTHNTWWNRSKNTKRTGQRCIHQQAW